MEIELIICLGGFADSKADLQSRDRSERIYELFPQDSKNKRLSSYWLLLSGGERQIPCV